MKQKTFISFIVGCLFLLCSPYTGEGQNGATDFLQQRKAIFEDLDKREVTTGFLSDYALDLIPLERYNGILQDSAFSDLTSQTLLFLTLASAHFKEAEKEAPDFGQYLKRCQAAPENALSLLLYQYNYIDKQALQKGEIEIQNKKIKSKVPQSSLYREQFVISLAPKKVVWNTLDISYYLPSNMVFSNVNQKITHYWVQFEGEKAFHPLYPEQRINYRYNSDGIKKLTFKLRLSDGQTLYSQTNILIRLPKAETRSEEQPEYHEIVKIPASEKHSGGRLLVRYARGKSKLVKPLIIAEGYDLSTLLPDFEQELAFFLRMFYRRNHKTFIDREDLDIVYLDYNNGVDDIWRNAELMKDAIRYVNRLKEGNHPNIVLGYSMGGLVAATALRQMEIAKEEHDTWKYISLDAPHHGATIPYGILAMVQHFVEEKGFLKNVLDLVEKMAPGAKIDTFSLPQGIRGTLSAVGKAPATLQLLISNPFDHTSQKHNEFYKSYHRLGLPQKTTNVAFSNGTLKSKRLYPIGSPILKVRGNAMIGILAHLLIMGIDFLAEEPLNPFCTSANLTLDMDVNSQAPERDCFYFKIEWKKYLFSIPALGKNILSYRRVLSQEPQYAVLEGGNASCWEYEKIKKGTLFEKGSSLLIELLSVNFDARADLKQDTISFIPRNSALYLNNWLANQGTLSMERAKSLSPFHRIYVASEKGGCTSHMEMQHHQYSMEKELAEPYIEPTYEPTLQGPNLLYHEGTYHLVNPKKELDYQFITHPTLIVTEQQGNTIKVTRKTNYFKDLRKAYIAVFAKKKDGLDTTTYKNILPVYTGVPDVQDIEAKQLSMTFKMDSITNQTILLPAIIVKWKGYGDILGSNWRYLRTSETLLQVDQRSQYAQSGVFSQNSLKADEIALLGAYNIDRQNITIQNSSSYSPNNSAHTDLDGNTPYDPNKEIDKPDPVAGPNIPIEWRNLENLPEVKSFYVFAPSSSITTTTTFEFRLFNGAGVSEWIPFTYEVKPPTIIRPILVPSLIINNLVSVATTSTDSSEQFENTDAWQGVVLKMEVWSSERCVYRKDVYTNETIDLSVLSPGTYIVRFSVGENVFEQKIIKN